MTRNDVLLAHINKQGAGLEIGPSHRPAAPKRNGYNVEIIDHLNRAQLKVKYKDHHHLNLNAIEEVDHIWSGESYTGLTGHSKHYDWIIASHVIEHTPDLIGFLTDCDDVIKDNGVVSLAVPDKRYCFDHFRLISGLGAVIDHHFNEYHIHSAGTVAEYVMNVVRKDGITGWHSHALEGTYDFISSVEQARRTMNVVQQHSKYVDCHAWCFVPHSFRLLIHDLHALGLIAFQEISFTPTRGSEFFVTLGRQGQGACLSRMEMLEAVQQEEATAHTQPARPTVSQVA